MNDTPCQRWREHRESYRPAGEPIDTTHYGVELVEDRDARRFVVGHHYQGSYPAARLAVGLYRTRAGDAAALARITQRRPGAQAGPQATQHELFGGEA